MKIKVYKSGESVWPTLKPNQKFIDISVPQNIYKRHKVAKNYYVIEVSDGRARSL